jgi:hypothetical protein
MTRGRLEAPLAQVEESEDLFDDLAHRNQTNASCDAQMRCTISTAFSVPTKPDRPLPRGKKRGRAGSEVELPSQINMAGGVSEATCAACDLAGLMVLVHSRRFRWACVALESAEDFVAVGREPVKGASVRNIIFAKIGVGCAGTREELRGSGEGSQLVRASGIEDENSRIAAICTGLR